MSVAAIHLRKPGSNISSPLVIGVAGRARFGLRSVATRPAERESGPWGAGLGAGYEGVMEWVVPTLRLDMDAIGDRAQPKTHHGHSTSPPAPRPYPPAVSPSIAYPVAAGKRQRREIFLQKNRANSDGQSFSANSGFSRARRKAVMP